MVVALLVGSSFAFISACQRDEGANPPTKPQPDSTLTEKHWTLIDINTTEHDQGSLLFSKVVSSTQDAMRDRSDAQDDPFVSAMNISITPQTVIVDNQGAPLTLSDLTVGMLIDITLEGPLAESYPLQGTAQKIVVQPRDERAQRPDGWILPEEAIQKALQIIRKDDATIWGLSDLEVTADAQATIAANGELIPNVWMITFLKGPDIGMNSATQPSSASDGQQKTTRAVTVDGQTGAVKHTIVAWNDAFRVYAPAPHTTIEPTFHLQGEARIFEGAFSYNLEDGHNILANGTIQASQGAPSWGTFDATITFDPASTKPYPQLTQILNLYEVSPKDGEKMHRLHIPLHLSP